ncbi:GTP cyclohydrolase I [Microterricola viridarii]|uniref:GTP cyclohydrolase 1 n=1 Tax=Microterricola viridarii TaxID=412690 RepID=A0A120I181_9MICO|nr:GTP cyclohydrolase I [Microterricola viridarii]AMB59283.1 GTP cyclohydrolase [Microterricola viridarii]
MPRQNAAVVTAFDDKAASPERRPVRAIAARRRPDREKAIAAVGQLLQALGRDPDSPHLADTPRRVADAFIEMLTPREFTATTFENEAGYAELVLVRDIPFTSLCEHPLLPFQGIAHIGYLPGERIIGLSKLARVLEHFSRELQVQERLTQQVADWLNEELGARGVGVVLEAEHQCMAARGARVTGSRTTTSAWHGELRSDRAARAEFLQLSGIGAASEEGTGS